MSGAAGSVPRGRFHTGAWENSRAELRKYLTLAQAAKVVTGAPSSAAVWRWCRRGVLARNGRRLRLRHARVGRRIYTTESWLSEFFDSVAAADCEDAASAEAVTSKPVRRRSASERKRAIRAAERYLDEEGL